MTLAAALAELLAVTEAGAASCAAGDTSPDAMLELVARRASAIDQVERARAGVTLDPAQRELLARAATLGDALLSWCADAQAQLERTRAETRAAPRSAPTTPPTARLLSDTA